MMKLWCACQKASHVSPLEDGNLQYSIMYVCICGQSQYTVQVGALSTLDRLVSAVKGSVFDGRVEYWHVLGGCHVL